MKVEHVLVCIPRPSRSLSPLSAYMGEGGCRGVYVHVRVSHFFPTLSDLPLRNYPAHPSPGSLPSASQKRAGMEVEHVLVCIPLLSLSFSPPSLSVFWGGGGVYGGVCVCLGVSFLSHSVRFIAPGLFGPSSIFFL